MTRNSWLSTIDGARKAKARTRAGPKARAEWQVVLILFQRKSHHAGDIPGV